MPGRISKPLPGSSKKVVFVSHHDNHVRKNVGQVLHYPAGKMVFFTKRTLFKSFLVRAGQGKTRNSPSPLKQVYLLETKGNPNRNFFA
jgi:hypothetical protein